VKSKLVCGVWSGRCVATPFCDEACKLNFVRLPSCSFTGFRSSSNGKCPPRASICWELQVYTSIFSNKSTNQIHQSLRFIARRSNTAQHVSDILLPIIRSLSIAAAASGLMLERGGSSAVGRGRSGPARPRSTALLPPLSKGKPEAATSVYKLLMMDKQMSETCWVVSKWRPINLRGWCIWLFDLFECRKHFGIPKICTFTWCISNVVL
jgi:hypothetical protein